MKQESSIILPGKEYSNYSYPDLLVSMNRTYYKAGKDWYDSHKQLQSKDNFMLTIRQFVDFINLLKSGKVYNGLGKEINQRRIDSILEDILTQREFLRAEWNDVKFKLVNGVLHIQYNHRHVNGQLQPQNSEPLEEYLMQYRRISLDHWLSNANSQGLPVPNTNNGSLYYWHPGDNSVAMFGSYSNGADLNCGRDPGVSFPALGVRRARIFSKDSITLEKEQVTPTLETENSRKLYSTEEIKTALDNANLSGLTNLVLEQLK